MSVITYARLRQYLDRQFDGLYSVLKASELITTWAGVQSVVRAGLADKFFSVGDQFVAEFDGAPVVWDIIGINHDIPADKNYKYSLTIQTHDCLMNAQYSAAQALYYVDTPLPAGSHLFTLSGAQYAFTTSQVVPVGGQIYVSSWEADGYVPTRITTYDADRTTAIEANLIVTPSTAGVDTISPVNHHQRCRYGSNNYLESSIRQWLNSESQSFEWAPKTNFDRPSNYSGGGGFLYRLDPELVAVLGNVDKQVIRNTVTDNGGQDIFSDKVFLLSRVEVYGGAEGIVTGEKAYDFYASMASAPTTAALDGRIKYLGSSARYWWLRSPDPGNANTARSVGTTGTVSGNGADGSRGTAPACCIV